MVKVTKIDAFPKGKGGGKPSFFCVNLAKKHGSYSSVLCPLPPVLPSSTIPRGVGDAAVTGGSVVT